MLQFLLTITDESNHDKIERIFKMYHDFMMKYAVSKFNNEGRMNALYDAEDAVQNTFIKIVKYIDDIDFAKGDKAVKSYVFSMLNNEIHTVLRFNDKLLDDIDSFSISEEFEFVNELDIKKRYEDVVKAIEGLDEIYSATLYLVIYQGKTVNEISKMMGISRQTVYSRLRRGRQTLISVLEEAKADE